MQCYHKRDSGRQRTALPGAMHAGQTTWKQEPSHRLFDSFIPAFLRDLRLAQNAYIMRTKCTQKRECDIFTVSAAMTYNSNPLKCTHFPAPHLNLDHPLKLNLIRGPHSCRLVPIRGYNPKLTKTDRY